MRPHEAFGLVPGDINLKVHEVRISAQLAKTGMPRGLPLSDVTVKALDEFLAVRPREWRDSDVVFTSVFGRQLNKDSWGDIMEKYSKRLDCKIRGYDLRHLFALAFLRRGGNAFALQRLMGHKSMDMTRRYDLDRRRLVNPYVTASDILDLALSLSSRHLAISRSPQERVIGCCREFALLTCAILRNKGIPARCRCGFATYLARPGYFEDHWACEYWDGQRWIMVDPQIDAFQQSSLENWTAGVLDPRPSTLSASSLYTASGLPGVTC